MSDTTVKIEPATKKIDCYSCHSVTDKEESVKCLSCGRWFCSNCINRDDICYDCIIIEYHPITNPKHYAVGEICTIDFIYDKQLEWCLGQAVKYIVRAGRKEATPFEDDIHKAIDYLKRSVERRRICPTSKETKQQV